MEFEYLPRCNGWSYIKWCGTDKWVSIQVPVKRFDDLWIDKDIIKNTRLIIMDVEWFEYNVLQGMSNALDKFANINIIIEIASGKSVAEKNKIFNYLEGKWYHYEKIDSEDWLFYK